ncbi:hypothetical protein [Chondromyces crocatus]|nr:hypothetical protein [Chondromyces crocatus]
MRRALSHSMGALAAAIAADLERTDEDRTFFENEKSKLEPLVAQLRSVHLAIEDHELGPGEVLQGQVEMGDEVLDRGVRVANTRTKLGLRGKSGLDASHAFGTRVDELVKKPLAAEPGAVLDAVQRLNDVPPFDEKEKLQQDLTRRAEQQESFLRARDAGYKLLMQKKSEAARLVVESALSLASLRGAMEHRFPRQRDYVKRFFMDARPRSPKPGESEGEGESG